MNVIAESPNEKSITKVTHVHKTPTQQVDLWFVDVEYADGTAGRKRPLKNSTFMGLILRLRMQNPALVCELPAVGRDDVNFCR